VRHRAYRHRSQEPARSLEDAYTTIEDDEVWLINCEIPEYSMRNRLNHKPKRKRKLLLHRREVVKFAAKASERGYTLVPLRMDFSHGLAKVEVAVARGKQVHDKREAQKNADVKRQLGRANRRH